MAAEPDGGGWQQGYSPVQWPDIQDVRQLNQKTPTEHMYMPSSQSMPPHPNTQTTRAGVSFSPQQVDELASWNVPPPEYFNTCQQTTATGFVGTPSQRDSGLLDGTFLPGAPRVMPAHESNANVPVTLPTQATSEDEAGDPDPVVLRSLGKAWLHRSKLRGMVRQLKGVN